MTKGSALLIVLVMVLVAVILANIALNLISSQSRLTHHQVSRIQAYYAGQAGVIYALEQMRLGAWNNTSCPANNPCRLSILDPVFHTTFPASVSEVNIIIRAPGTPGCINPPGNTACVSATATYTYTLP